MLCIYIYIYVYHNVSICTYCKYTYKRRCSINIYHHVFKKPYNPPLPSKHWSLKVQRAVKTSGVKVPKANNLRTRMMVTQGNWIIPNVEPIYHLCLHTARHIGSILIDPPPKKKRCMIGIAKKHSNHLTSAFPLPPCP